ncbi:hypothetical protein [Streptomyces sp. NPDC050121]|uniref:hypothetical protein n=1 Tax=Streptomyces sp. NPDC050121 TaxID=3365601 RepID=UPI0037B0A1DE
MATRKIAAPSAFAMVKNPAAIIWTPISATCPSVRAAPSISAVRAPLIMSSSGIERCGAALRHDGADMSREDAEHGLGSRPASSGRWSSAARACVGRGLQCAGTTSASPAASSDSMCSTA